MRISNSFSEGEIQVLEFILQTLLRGGTPAMATRNKDFASLYRKVVTMKKRVQEKKAEQLRRQQALLERKRRRKELKLQRKLDMQRKQAEAERKRREEQKAKGWLSGIDGQAGLLGQIGARF